MKKALIYRIAELVGVFSICRYLHRSRPVILMYHRIVSDPALPGITPSIFKAQLEHLIKHFNILPVDQLVQDIKNNAVKPYSVAITFDDGHSDFYTDAWPLLKQMSVPATLYVTTGFLDHKLWLWPDLLRYLVLKTPVSHTDIAPLGAVSLSTENERLSVWNRLGDYCLTIPAEQRLSYLQTLASQLQVDVDSQPRPPFSPVSWEQLRCMHAEGLNVGSHTVTHPVLSAQPEEQLIIEMRDSKQRIKDELDITPTGICYPNGMAVDISPQVEKVAAQFYSYGVAAYPAPTDSTTPMHIGRRATRSALWDFKKMMDGVSRRENTQGAYL